MTNDQKDAICQLCVEIFGTQEGVGYNCPQGAYDFAEVVMAYTREQCAKTCEEQDGTWWPCKSTGKECAEIIRSGGKK